MKLLARFMVIALIVVGFCGCKEDKKDTRSFCRENPTAKGCPRYSGNIERPAHNTWSFGTEDKTKNK